MDYDQMQRNGEYGRHYQPSTVSRRLSVVVGFYRVCVIDAILAQFTDDYVRRRQTSGRSPAQR